MAEEFIEDGIYGEESEVQETEHEEPEDQPEESEEEASEDDESSEQEPPKKKTGFVEFDTPEQKARVAQLTREKHDSERKYKAAMEELKQFKQTTIVAPKEVPAPTADFLTEPQEYEKQRIAREQYIAEQVRYEDLQKAHVTAQENLEKQRSDELVKSYTDNALKMKIKPETLTKAGEICASYGITGNKDLTEYLLKDPKGAAIVVHLGSSENADELSLIASMSATEAVDYIASHIKPKLSVKQTSKAAAPPTKVSGSRGKASTTSGWEIS
jgi:DNA mismatch repair ATPase MutL